jgi:hypothetical protein
MKEDLTMTKLHILILVCLICFIANPIYSQFSRNDANNLVLNQILDDGLDKVDVYSSFTTLSQSGTIPLWNGQNLENPYSSSWCFFVDDLVFANWEHPCRYIFVNSATGNYTIFQKRTTSAKSSSKTGLLQLHGLRM